MERLFMEELLREQVFRAVICFLRTETLPASANVLQFETQQRAQLGNDPSTPSGASDAIQHVCACRDATPERVGARHLSCTKNTGMVAESSANAEAPELDPFLVGSAVLYGVREAVALELSAERLLHALDDASAARKRRRRFFVTGESLDRSDATHVPLPREEHGSSCPSKTAGSMLAPATGPDSPRVPTPKPVSGAAGATATPEPTSREDALSPSRASWNTEAGHERLQTTSRVGTLLHYFSTGNGPEKSRTNQLDDLAGQSLGVDEARRLPSSNTPEAAALAAGEHLLINDARPCAATAEPSDLPLSGKAQQSSGGTSLAHTHASSLPMQPATTRQSDVVNNQTLFEGQTVGPASVSADPRFGSDYPTATLRRNAPITLEAESAALSVVRAPMLTTQSAARSRGRAQTCIDEDATRRHEPQHRHRRQQRNEQTIQRHAEENGSMPEQRSVVTRGTRQERVSSTPPPCLEAAVVDTQHGRVRKTPGRPNTDGAAVQLATTCNKQQATASSREANQRSERPEFHSTDVVESSVASTNESLQSGFDLEKLQKLKNIDVDAFLMNKVYAAMRDERSQIS